MHIVFNFKGNFDKSSAPRTTTTTTKTTTTTTKSFLRSLMHYMLAIKNKICVFCQRHWLSPLFWILWLFLEITDRKPEIRIRKVSFPYIFFLFFLWNYQLLFAYWTTSFAFQHKKRIGKLVSAQHFFSLFGQKIPNKSHVFSLVVSVCVWPTWKLAIRKIQALHDKSVF